MRILNTKDPDDAIRLFPWIVPTPTETREQIVYGLAQRLKEAPEDTLVLVAIERDIARAVLVAHVSEAKRRSVWLWQVRSVPGFRYSRLMFDALTSWTKAKHCKVIRGNTSNRDRDKVFERRYGFRRKGQEMVYHVAK